MRLLTNERDKLKNDLEAVESDVAEFSKRCDLSNQAQEITAKVLAKANAQREGLIDKIDQLEETTESLRAECYNLRGKNLKLKSVTEEAEIAKVENFRNQFEFTPYYENLQAFFVNFGARQVLAELKEQHPTLDLSAVEDNYPAPEDVAQPPADGA
ncbi:uncharacterized protein Fot_28753 [Forsythia ovata]|uniref:Uncharacterized protein n=1 Tax=Forsythia ovata TaxID=205694 RepID=A0ABD1TPX3_9LAMI